MRNGLDISGVSELVHEISTNPEEAPIIFDVVGTWKRGSALAEVRTAHYGTIRMARGWTVESDPADHEQRSAPSPEELTLAALGACVLVTHAHGYSARGISLSGLRVGVTGSLRHASTADTPTPAHLFENLRYAIGVECDGDDDQMRGLSQFVTCFSPNHRAFLDAGELAVELQTADGTTTALASPPVSTLEATEASAAPPCDVKADLTWEYATQAHVRMTLGAALNPKEESYDIVVDQAKQMVGLDSGPNPQELLLAATVSELLFLVHDEAERRGIALDTLRVESGGRLDIRGMLNVDPEVPARFHRIGLRIVAHGAAPNATMQQLADAALARSVCIASLQFPYSIDLALKRGDTSLLEMTSNVTQVDNFLKMMAEKNQAAHALEK